MLVQGNQSNLTKKISFENSALSILFYLTTNDRNEIDKLKSVFQQYNINLMRLTGIIKSDFSKVFSSFSKNACLIAWTNNYIFPQGVAILSQVLISKAILIAFFYEGQMWPLSRLKKIQKTFLKPSSVLNSNFSPFSFFWFSFQNFVI